jgi:predicted nucleic acid-binding protein
MKVVVADTSPINYLVWIGEVDLLPRLYGSVLIPDIAAAELCDPDAPAAVVKWAAGSAFLD